MKLSGINQFNDRLLVNHPEIWLLKPVSLIVCFVAMMVVALLLGIGLRQDDAIMRALDGTSITHVESVSWLEICGNREQLLNFDACIQNEYPTSPPQSIEEIREISQNFGVGSARIISAYQSVTEGVRSVGVLGVTAYLFSLIFWRISLQSKTVYKRRNGIGIFLSNYVVQLLLMIPVALFLFLLFPYPNMALNVFVGYGAVPLISNLAVGFALFSLQRRNALTEVELTASPATANQQPTLASGETLAFIFLTCLLGFAYLMRTEWGSLLPYFVLIYLLLVAFAFCVVSVWYASARSNTGVIFTYIFEVTFFLISLLTAAGPIIVMYLLTGDKSFTASWLPNFLAAIASLIGGLLLAWLGQLGWNRLRALPA